MTEKVTPKQARGIAALLTEPTITAAAAKAGVAPKTIYKWLRQPEFSAELTAAQAREIETAGRRLAGMQSAALDALTDILTQADEQSALNIGDFFTEEEYIDPKTQAKLTRVGIDLAKIKEKGKLVKKVRIVKGELSVEVYDKWTANNLKDKVAEAIIANAMQLRKFSDLEARVKAVEDRVQNDT